MSVLSQFFAGGRFITDPTLFSRMNGLATKFARNGNLSTSADIFTGTTAAIDRIPGSVQDDTNWTADTYKTILNLSGQSGLVVGFLGPTLPTAGDTNTMRITVDGAAYTIVLTAQVNAGRSYLACVRSNTIYTTVDTEMAYAGTSSDGLTAYITFVAAILSPSDALATGATLLRFSSSLMVEMKISVNLTTTTNVERRSAVILQRTA